TVQAVTGRLNIDGQAGTDYLAGPNTSNTWNITDNNEGNINGLIYFTSVENLDGGSGSDWFRLSNGKGVSGYIQGNGGIDALDYSAYTPDAVVSMPTYQATNVGAWIWLIENAVGGSGNDILVGDGNNNRLTGNDGRDLLVGGEGSDTLFGGSGDTA